MDIKESPQKILDYIKDGKVIEVVNKEKSKRNINWKKWGENPSDIVSTDITNNYILELLKEKKNQSPLINYAMTEGVVVDAKKEKKDLNFRTNVAKKLADTYSNIIEKTSDNKAIIYTVLNTQGINIYSHQNWLCLDLYKNILYRFEPSNDYPEFQTKEFCQEIIKFLKIDVTYMLVNRPLNVFSGCRAVSTLLASVYLMGIDLKQLDVFNKDKNMKVPLIKPIIYLLQHEMNICQNSKFISRNTRLNNNLSFVIL